MPLRIDIITIFPDMFGTVLETSIPGRAATGGHVSYHVHDLRDWTEDRHRTVDDTPYGGGPGMVMKPEPLVAAIESLAGPRGPDRKARALLLSPQGRRLEQERLEARRTEMAQWEAEEESRRDELASMRDVRARVLARVTDRRRQLAEQARELEEKERKLTRFIDTLVADAESTAGEPAAEPGGTSIREFRGVLDWPVADPDVEIEFGPRRDPRYLTEVPHNGLGLGVETGTRVRSVFPGEVLYAAEFEGYGPMVVVRHAGRVFTLYAGLQLLNVGPGDVLSLGDVLGASGDSLYFEIRVDNQPEDPRSWLR